MEREEATSAGATAPENEAEMRLYLDKLKEIVPHCPKNKRVSRLELIQHVIDYICDLQQALEDRANLRGADLNFMAQQEAEAVGALWKNGFVGSRQPLGVLPQPQNVPDPRAEDAGKSAGTAAGLFETGTVPVKPEIMIRRDHGRQSGHPKHPPLSSFFSGAENG